MLEAEAERVADVSTRKRKITYAEYTRMGHMLGRHLQRQEEEGHMTTEEELIGWYMDQKEQDLLQLVINRMVDKDRVLLVARHSDDANHPERRLLAKHPNWAISDGRMRAGRQA